MDYIAFVAFLQEEGEKPNPSLMGLFLNEYREAAIAARATQGAQPDMFLISLGISDGGTAAQRQDELSRAWVYWHERVRVSSDAACPRHGIEIPSLRRARLAACKITGV